MLSERYDLYSDKTITIEANRILLDHKHCDYTIEM